MALMATTCSSRHLAARASAARARAAACSPTTTRPRPIGIKAASRSSSGALRARGAGVRSRAAALERESSNTGSKASVTLQLGGGTTLSFPVNADEASRARGAVRHIFDIFKEKEALERPRRMEDVKFTLAGDEGAFALQLYCNPNAHPSAFQAKVLVSFKSEGGVTMTSEAPLSSLRAAFGAGAGAADGAGRAAR